MLIKISYCKTPCSELSVVYLPLQFLSSRHPYFLNFIKQNQRYYGVSQVGTENCITRQYSYVCQFNFLARLGLPVSLGLIEDTIRNAGWAFETVSGLMFSVSRTESITGYMFEDSKYLSLVFMGVYGLTVSWGLHLLISILSFVSETN